MGKLLFSLMLCLIIWPAAAHPQEAAPWQIGLRGGLEAELPFEKAGADEQYAVAEGYLLRYFGWQQPLGEAATLRSRLDASLGYLAAGDDVGGWLALGGDLVLCAFDDRLELEGGLRPAILFRDEYGDDDFGGPLQFLLHLGLAVNIDKVSLNYRFQHMSNAGIYQRNPGIDLHMIGIGYRFDGW